MKNESIFYLLSGWIFGLVILTLGILNLILVHPVPGVAYLLLSLIFFPPINAAFRKNLGLSIPLVFKIILGVVIIWFTLGISDLAEMYGL